MVATSQKGETLAQSLKQPDERLEKEIVNFCKHIAGSSQIIAACMSGGCIANPANTKAVAEVLLVIRLFPPRLMNYVKVSENRNIVVLAVDQWIFERDVDRGFLGEALAGRMIFPYVALISSDYLHSNEIRLKKRLILEMLENLVLDFPELSNQFLMKPAYFMYEAMLSRIRLFPPMVYNLHTHSESETQADMSRVLHGYLEALKGLEKEKLIVLSKGYVQISKDFTDKAHGQTARFMNLLKSGQRTMFMSLLSLFPKTMDLLSQDRAFSLKTPVVFERDSKAVLQVEDPQKYLYLPTASGLVPLSSRIDIETYARKALGADKRAKVEVHQIGGILNDVFLVRVLDKEKNERKIVAKRFRDWSSFKWFPLTLWSVGTRSFAVLGRPRLEKEIAMNEFLYSKGFGVPRILHASPNDRLVFMEFVEGRNMGEIVRKTAEVKSRRELRKDLTLIGRVGRTFAKVHALGVGLGDTKPENVMIGKNSEIIIMDFEQASKGGDKVWDVAEFLYYAGHDLPPLVEIGRVELIAKAFVEGYLKGGGDVKTVQRAGNPKYTKVFSIFTLPHVMLAISNVCRKADKFEA